MHELETATPPRRRLGYPMIALAVRPRTTSR